MLVIKKKSVPGLSGSAFVVSVESVRRVNGELISGDRVNINNAPSTVRNIVNSFHPSSEDIERIARHAFAR